jgi:hypothetical protein
VDREVRLESVEMPASLSSQPSHSRGPVSTDDIIIHISTRNVSFSILIGQNSVAEWLSG